ncbi:dTDP-Rha:alpha-D-GlcNAc-pyrophosphate polyprenol, alpha-3-L-rhamnosyltransferase [Buttiauxella agrestis]|uniref:dTDP-Rha:alpha-D-GlcNAc-pyrophosphate polyprenol, alpha-3-L-rhamnosyltransferase n=1 Tax=Buttiauxella agrestis TaxID=82977 RepID=A0A381C5F3_9ENTR|nr:glycosyltransferase family 2 protein [Buttiauxella agrestis]SUW63090.1 dTDP-Rha:alpha-D-GlcNAc-pyrophosphate polyprenol, alpha-3-L-rhamnosyltransferase [Buttiauxella agrestis]
MKIGLVTVLYNSPAVLTDFFSSLAVQNYNEYCLYVVDNSSSSESLNLARKLSAELFINVKFIDNQGSNVGVAAGNNQGAREAYEDNCDYILFLNNDLLFENPNILKSLVIYADSQKMDMVSPTILNYPEKKVWYCGGYFDEWKSLAPHKDIDTAYNAANFPPVHQHDYAPTCFLMVSRHLWDTIGEMDEKYFAYYDDTDFLYRARKAGFVVNVISDLIIYHKVGSSTGGDLSYFGMYHLTRNRLYFIRKNLHGLKKAYSLSYLFLTRLYMLIFTSNRQKKAIRKGLIDGLRMK